MKTIRLNLEKYIFCFSIIWFIILCTTLEYDLKNVFSLLHECIPNEYDSAELELGCEIISLHCRENRMSVSCRIDKKLENSLKKISRDIKAKKTFNNNLLAIKNIKSKLPSLSSCLSPKLKSKIALHKLKSKIKHSVPKLKPPKMLGIPNLPLIPSLIPKLPLLPALPIIPPLPLIAPLPLLPLPLVPPPLLPFPILPPPILPKLPKPLKSLRLQKLKSKYSLQKALGSEIKPVRVPIESKNNKILEKLLKMKNDRLLTTGEYLRFKKILKL